MRNKETELAKLSSAAKVSRTIRTVSCGIMVCINTMCAVIAICPRGIIELVQNSTGLYCNSNAQDGAAAIQNLDELQEVTKKQSEEIRKLVSSFNSERVLRKKYYNMIEDMKGKIRVYCRVRPLSSSEKERVS